MLSIMIVATALRADAAQSPCLRPNLVLRGPTMRDENNVPIVIKDEMSCWTVGSRLLVE